MPSRSATSVSDQRRSPWSRAPSMPILAKSPAELRALLKSPQASGQSMVGLAPKKDGPRRHFTLGSDSCDCGSGQTAGSR